MNLKEVKALPPFGAADFLLCVTPGGVVGSAVSGYAIMEIVPTRPDLAMKAMTLRRRISRLYPFWSTPISLSLSLFLSFFDLPLSSLYIHIHIMSIQIHIYVYTGMYAHKSFHIYIYIYIYM